MIHTQEDLARLIEQVGSFFEFRFYNYEEMLPTVDSNGNVLTYNEYDA